MFPGRLSGHVCFYGRLLAFTYLLFKNFDSFFFFGIRAYGLVMT